MQRRVNKVGKGTLTVSLPARWARQQGITPASQLEIEERGSTLIIGTEATEIELKVEIDLRGRTCYARKHLIQAYKKGYDEIKIFYDSARLLHEVTDTLGVLIGFEIIEQQRDYLVLRSVAKQFDNNVDQLIDRAVIITSRMLLMLQEALEGQDQELLKQVIKTEQINNSMCLVTERILAKQGYVENYRMTPFLMVFMYRLEVLADELRLLAEIIDESPALLKGERTKAGVAHLLKVHNVFMSFFRTGDAKLLDGLQQHKDEALAQLRGSPQLSGIMLQICTSLYDLGGIMLAMRL